MAAPSLDEKLTILHKYFLNESSMFSAFYNHHKAGGVAQEHDPQSWSYMTLWYGCLSVVAEAWQRLKEENGVTDKDIDSLLQSPNLELLKILRNDVFHVTNWNYFNGKTMDFIKADGSAKWVNELHQAFSKYFLNWLETRKGKTT